MGELTPKYKYIKHLRDHNQLEKEQVIKEKARRFSDIDYEILLLKLKGHLLNTFSFNYAMDILEKHQLEFQIIGMKVGNSSLSRSVVEVQIRCDKMEEV